MAEQHAHGAKLENGTAVYLNGALKHRLATTNGINSNSNRQEKNGFVNHKKVKECVIYIVCRMLIGCVQSLRLMRVFCLKVASNGGLVDSSSSTYSSRQWDEFKSKESYEEVPLVAACLTYMGFYLLMLLGYFNQLFFTPKVATERFRDGYPSLFGNFDRFYLQYVFRRIRDCWNRPICSVPGAELVIKDRITRDYGWSFEFTGTETKCLNLGSYNYLGFAEATGPCADDVEETIKTQGLAACTSRRELGTSDLHLELEALTAEFLGVEDAIVFGMGFATNSLNIPSLMTPGCLVSILSYEII